MLTGKYRRIYHYHLKKCGGTTLNHWLDTLTCDERAFKGGVWDDFSVIQTMSDETGETSVIVVPSRARTLFHWSDVVYGHKPLRIYAPENTFCLTVLRDPVQRLVSQVYDWRRLSHSDTINSPSYVQACVKDSQRLSLGDFLEKYGRLDGRDFLDNYLARALVAGRIGNGVASAVDVDDLCEVALQSLEKDYDLVGLTEHLDLARNALCAMVGLPPARAIPTLNATRTADHRDPEVKAAGDILNSLTRIDQVIYDRARQLFDRRHRPVAEAYDTAAFETRHAGRLLAEARGHAWDGATRYSVRAPIIGSGFHGRDGSGTPSCSVWSGPDTRATLFIPTPPDMPLSLLVWIRGYAGISQRDQLRVRVDGSPVAHRFESAADYADVLTVDTCSTRDFIRLDVDVDETLAFSDPTTGSGDSRRRGFAFDNYGWRPILLDTFAERRVVAQPAPKEAAEQHCEGLPENVFALIAEAEAKLEGWCTRAKAVLIARTVLWERPRICIEIGVFGGRSLVPCAAALRHIGDGVIYGIETWSPKIAVENATDQAHEEWWSTLDFPAIKRAFYRFVAETKLTRHVRLIEAPSGRAAALFDQIDFLHIDGSHSAVNAAEDVIRFTRKVRSGGIIMFDDASWPSVAPARELLATLCDRVPVPCDPESGRDVCAMLRRR